MKIEWDYTHLYKTNEDWENDYKIVSKRLKQLEESLTDKLTDSKNFIEIITNKFQIEEMIERLYCYGKRHVDQDSTNEEMTGLYQRAWNLYAKFLKLQTNIETMIIENEETLKEWQSCPEIKHHEVYLYSIIERKKHMILEKDRSALVILNKQQLLINQMYRSLMEQDIRFGEFTDHKGNKVIANNKLINKYSKSKYDFERRDSFLANMEGYKQLENSMTNLINMKLEKEITISKLKHYNSVLEMKLSDDLLPNGVVENLINSVNNHIAFSQQYIELKKELSGIDEYHAYDKNLSISKINSKHYELEDAIDTIKKAISILGEKSISYIDKALEEGWIDFFEKPNKRKDSVTCITYPGVPYVSVNFNENLQSLRTLGHEFGHMIHTAYAKDNQPYEHFEYSLFLAEIASKVNEILLDEYLVEHSESKEEKIYLLDNSIKGIINSLFNQVMMTEFEVELFNQKNQNGNVSTNYINQLYNSLYKKYNGDAVTYDKEIENAWEQISHFYIQDNFYLWQYATGVCIAGKIVYQLKNNPDFIQQYIKFLSLGKSVSIIDALKVINIDLSDSSYIDDTVKVLEKQFTELKQLVKK